MYEKKMFILDFIVFLCSIVVVSAAENGTDGLQSIEDMSINQETHIKLEKTMKM